MDSTSPALGVQGSSAGSQRRPPASPHPAPGPGRGALVAGREDFYFWQIGTWFLAQPSHWEQSAE